MTKKVAKTNDEANIEKFVRAYAKAKRVFARPTPAEFARSILDADLCRFEWYALDLFVKHDHRIEVKRGVPVLLAKHGKSVYRPNYDAKQLANVVAQIQATPNVPQELAVAALIAAAIPRLRQELHEEKLSWEFASAVCRISAAVPDTDAGTRLLSGHQSKLGKKGGEAKKVNTALQEFVTSVVTKLAPTGKVTHARFWKYLTENYSDYDGTETGIAGCDDAHIDGDTLCWTDGDAINRQLKRSSLKRYVTRAKSLP